MCKLLELRALDVRSTPVRLLPELTHGLRHLLINSDTMDDGILIELPGNNNYIFGCWKFLETLETIDLRNCSTEFIRGLVKLRFLEVLAITRSFHQTRNIKELYG
jgi:hypothetical protein